MANLAELVRRVCLIYKLSEMIRVFPFHILLINQVLSRRFKAMGPRFVFFLFFSVFFFLIVILAWFLAKHSLLMALAYWF